MSSVEKDSQLEFIFICELMFVLYFYRGTIKRTLCSEIKNGAGALVAKLLTPTHG